MSVNFIITSPAHAVGAAILAACLGVSPLACTVHDVKTDPAPELSVPDRFDGAIPTDGAVRPPDRWWEAFGDAELDAYVERALAGNLDIKRGWARLAQIRALAEGAEAGLWPTLTADASVGRQRTVFNLGEPIGLVANETPSYTLGLSARYEVDLWGKVGSAESAAEADARATRFDLETAAMTLSGRVTEVWLGIVGEREALRLLDEQEATSKKFVDLLELRFGQGAATALDVLQQRQAHAALTAQRPLSKARLGVYEHQLAVLLGQVPGAVAAPARAELPALPPAPDAGLPVELLGRRPDIRAAQARVVAADYRVGAAIADRYPAISLSGRIGFQAAHLEDFIDSWIWNLAASLVAPLFDGGRRAAEVERQKAALEDVLHGYAQVVLAAIVEVEDALVQEAHQAEYVRELDAQLAIARSSLDEARQRYVTGLTSYLNVLTSLRALQQVEQSHLAARRQLLSTRIQLYRALGGAWTETLAPADRGEAPTADDGGPRCSTPRRSRSSSSSRSSHPSWCSSSRSATRAISRRRAPRRRKRRRPPSPRWSRSCRSPSGRRR